MSATTLVELAVGIGVYEVHNGSPGKLLTPDVAPVGDAPLTDGATINAGMFLNRFPYLNSPLPGSPNEPTITIVPQTAAAVEGQFKDTPGTYDPATRKLTVPAAGNNAFLRVKADGKVALAAPQVADGKLTATVK